MKVGLNQLPSNATMAHVLAFAGIFPSVSQARKNGWNDVPITLGLHVIGKKKVPIEVVEVNEEEKKEAYRPDLEPGFWPEYQEPKTAVSWAVQFPLNDPRWADRMVTAYYRDSVEARKRS